MGFNVLNSESKSFGVTPKTHSHNACLDQVAYADYLILIIGGRRGGNFIGTEKTITNEEFSLAQKHGIPVIAFVMKSVYSQIATYKKNPTADFSHVVDDKRIFDFISYVASGHEDNWIHEYSCANDIQDILTTQFAYYLKLFSQSLRPQKDKSKVRKKGTVVDFPSNLTVLDNKYKDDQDILVAEKNGLRIVHRVISKIVASETPDASKEEKLKSIWLIARYGEFSHESMRIKADKFKDYAWSTTKGKRVFTQLEAFGILCRYEEDYDKSDVAHLFIIMSFAKVKDPEFAVSALYEYVKTLLKKNSEEEALELFKRADMRLYSS